MKVTALNFKRLPALRPITTIKVLIVGSATLALASASALATFANVARQASPRSVLRYVPGDALAPAIAADTALIEGKGTNPDVIARSAKLTLSRQAINARALRVLALTSEAERERNRFVAASEALSRHDLGTQLLLIQSSVERDDAGQALNHYDIALRTSEAAPAILFPILTSAIEDAQIQAALAPIIGRQPVWLRDFLSFAIADGARPSDLAAAIMRAGRLPDSPDFHLLESSLIARLVAVGDGMAARVFYATLRGARPGEIAATGFAEATIDPRFAPLTWDPVVDANTEVSVLDDGKGFRVVARSGAKAVVLRRLLFLPPGRRVLRATIGPADRSNESGIYIGIRCLRTDTSGQIWLSPNLARPGPLPPHEFIVPEKCNSQMVELLVSTGATQQGLEFEIREFSVV
jgi:hypothetical protein